MINHRVLSFKYALTGIFRALKEEPNLKFHFLVTLLVIIAGFFLQITRAEWMIILILIGLVIAVELTNTAVEEVVNSFTIEEHPGAKRAKDISAGAVLVVAIIASIIGLMIFLPHLYTRF